LGIDLDRSHEFEAEIAHGCEGIKPGWVRVNFNYFVSDEVTDYIVEAVRLVARDGWRLLPDYRFDNATGRWAHRSGPVEPPLRLRDVGYAADGSFVFPRHTARATEGELAAYLREGARILGERADDHGPQATVSPGYDDLRWFELPAASMS
ncbi:MAG TPA: aminotransferase, partial [Dermatophilaceae bacterium]|nr:aminotransferase [Dermatophilaceae bacterium]